MWESRWRPPYRSLPYGCNNRQPDKIKQSKDDKKTINYSPRTRPLIEYIGSHLRHTDALQAILVDPPGHVLDFVRRDPLPWLRVLGVGHVERQSRHHRHGREVGHGDEDSEDVVRQ